MIFSYATIKRLAQETGYRVTELLALAPQNDPFYMGTEADVTQAAWFADIYRRAGYGNGRTPHLRRIHYWTVSQSPAVLMPNGLPYENTNKCWEYLIKASKAARYLDYVPLTGITDNKNPTPHIHAHYWQNTPEYEISVPDLTAPGISIYGIHDANAQPYHLELWCEKSTMNDVLLPVCNQYSVNLVTFEGEVSITSVCVDLLNRIKSSGRKPTRIWYISDFDPAGNSMPVAMSRKIEFMTRQAGAAYDVRVTPVALTADQVKAYRLPRIPIKETEKRAGKFEAAFGSGAVELDALEALYPGRLAQIITDAIKPYYSTTAAADVRRQQQALAQAVQARIDAITARYADQIEALQDMITELKAIDLDAEAYAVERYAPHVQESDGWLFDSRRDYVAQITRYKAHKGIETDFESIA